MKLGIMLDHNRPTCAPRVEVVKAAERLGYDSVWSAEIYGADALSPLAFLAGQTQRITLATGVIQLAARTPTNAAMTIATIDQLAGGGRTILGIGVSGPQIVEGWYGQPWGSPLARLRDYVTIIRQTLNREESQHDGPEIALPYRGPGSTGQGVPLKLILHPPKPIPIYLGVGGPKSVALMAELADGWLPLGLTPYNFDTYRPAVEEGLARSPGKTLADLDIVGATSVNITTDLEGAWTARKPAVAFMVGGYGSATHNFHRDAMVRRGFGEAAEKIGDLFRANKRDEAVAAVPNEYIDESGLYGDLDRIRARWQDWMNGPHTTIRIMTDDIETLEMMADWAGVAP